MTKKLTVILDGNDELLGRQVFKILNTFYRRFNLNMAYGNFIQYSHPIHQVQLGFSTEYE